MQGPLEMVFIFVEPVAVTLIFIKSCFELLLLVQCVSTLSVQCIYRAGISYISWRELFSAEPVAYVKYYTFQVNVMLKNASLDLMLPPGR